MIFNSAFDELRTRAQLNLVNFLRTELELGFTFARTAQLEASMNNREHSERALEYAASAIETIRRFESRITDSQALAEIRRRADDLQKFISSSGVDSSKQGA
jgi:hypothetical protein